MARKEKIPNHVRKWQSRDEIKRKERVLRKKTSTMPLQPAYNNIPR
jgi:hypothetical protein